MARDQLETAVGPTGVDARRGRMLHALGDENRLRIVATLRSGEKCVCHLTEELLLSQSLLSHHLRVLRMAGLVSDRKDGRWVHYSLVGEALDSLATFFSELRDATNTTPSSNC
jgi:ArsR family transcriptional regulator